MKISHKYQGQFMTIIYLMTKASSELRLETPKILTCAKSYDVVENNRGMENQVDQKN